MCNKAIKRNAYALSFSGLLVIGLSSGFREVTHHAAMPFLVALIGFGMVLSGAVLQSRLIDRQEKEIAKLMQQLEGQNETMDHADSRSASV